MVEIERPDNPTWQVIAVRRKSEETVEMRFVSRKGPKGDKFVVLTPGEARCVGCLLLAAAEHPTGGRFVFESDNAGGLPLIARRAPSGPVELRLWERRGPRLPLSLPTTRRVAHALMAESQELTLPEDAPQP